MNDQLPPIQKLASYLKAAAQQRYLMEPRIQDKHFLANGGKLLHAVDTDVIKLYTDPFELSIPTQRRREGYAQIFPDDLKPVSIALGRTLADFIFRRLDTTPLLVIPPLEQEIRVVYQAVHRDSEIEKKQSVDEFGRLQNLSGKLGKLEQDEQVVALMLEHAPTLARFFGGTRGHTAEYLRYLRLLKDKRLLPLDLASPENSMIEDADILSALAPVTDLADLVKLREFREDWITRLKASKSSSREAIYIFDDAQMLARIEWINRAFGSKTRLVLISGDHAMHEAGRAYTPEGEEADFATLYLRHPKAYLAERWVLSPENENGEGVENEFYLWLETFLANVQMEGCNHREALKQLSDKPVTEIEQLLTGLQKDPSTLVTQFSKNWSDYTKSIMLAHGQVSVEEYELHPALLKLWDDITTAVTRVEEQINCKVLETWDAFFESATATGYVFLREGNRQSGRKRARNAPLLAFDTFSEACLFSKKILESYDPAYLDAYRRNIDELQKKDDSRYTYYLAFGVLFAAEGAWNVAAILARRALEIAQKIRQSPISGREAAYLLAVALRHSASCISDLEGVAALLTQAEKCLIKDKTERPKLSVRSTRFEAERVALALTYHLFHHFLGEVLPDDVPTLSQISTNARNLLDDMGNEQDEVVRMHTERHLLTNLFMVALLEKEQTDGQSLIPLKPYLEQMESNLKCSATPSTFLVATTQAVTACLLEQNAQKKKSLQRKAKIILNDQDIEAAIVMPYDLARFHFFRKLLEMS